jgi:hypothetical protein
MPTRPAVPASLARASTMRYAGHVIERARAAVDDVLGSIGERAFPFDRT